MREIDTSTCVSIHTTGARPCLVKQPCPSTAIRGSYATVAKRPSPCMSYQSFKMFKISSSEVGTVGMRRQTRASTNEFLVTVTEGVVGGVYNIGTRLSFGVTRRHKASGGNCMFAIVSQGDIRTSDGS